eukprot:TRINITY_DN4489_c0_g1_i1.p1 TRINITY_DN4489_c0_g1~~TRINITY_DN4489_c0_g1_i1.p1  ORF type:complete len:568 (-),score=64.59 TRINITY_DN4489_c0_g1_i1:260-1963(-)
MARCLIKSWAVFFIASSQSSVSLLNCSFAGKPADRYFWDGTCENGLAHIGCNADGVHMACRWCGKEPYPACPQANLVGRCFFLDTPASQYAWDERCEDPASDHTGCYADGVHMPCRWCGTAPYPACPEATSVATTVEVGLTRSTSTTVPQTSHEASSTSSAKTGGMPPFSTLRGICYGALPCLGEGCGGGGLPSEDMVQIGYKKQWGHPGRDDLGTMVQLGANAVRLYHSLGLGAQGYHGAFLDRAEEVGLHVMAGFHTRACPKFNCFSMWKAATLLGFEQGFTKYSRWHPAVGALILLNEPDFFDYNPSCQPFGSSWCHVKAALSALDGVLAAEREAGIDAGHVKLTITWSFAMRTSVDGKVTGPGVFGFQDMVAGIANPSLAHYSPESSRAELETAFQTRWIHGLNTQAPWSFVDQMVSSVYKQFLPNPWFIGEYGANGQVQAVIQHDLEAMQKRASRNADFLGAAVFQFETAYWKGGSEMNFGLFSVGVQKIAETDEVCDSKSSCRKWPVNCLSTDLPWLPGSMAKRAEAVAAAWNGSVDRHSTSFCRGSASRRLRGSSQHLYE